MVENIENITLDDVSNNVLIRVLVDDKEVYDILYNKSSAERIDIVKRSVKIGMMALRNATITVDTRYVQKEVERLLAEIDNSIKKNLGSEGMKGELEKIFGANGSLEINLRDIFKSHDSAIADILREDNINSPLYKIKRFIDENSRQSVDNIYNMLDPGNKDSLLFRLKEDILKRVEEIKKTTDIDSINKSIERINVANKDGNDNIKKEIQIMKEENVNNFIDVKKSFHEEISDVRTMVTGTHIELAKLTKEKQIVDLTTLKGMNFEDVLFEFLSTKALTKYGDTIDVVNLSGGDKAGDIIINIKGSQEKIIIKAESTNKENVQTADTILRHLNSSMKERSAGYGIKVYENELPERIGPILVGDDKIVCSYLRGYAFEGYPLEVAYEILRASILRKNLGVDRADAKVHIDNIVRSLNSIQHITGNLSKIENICANTKDQLEDLRKNISCELGQILVKSNEYKGKEEKKLSKSRKKGK